MLVEGSVSRPASQSPSRFSRTPSIRSRQSYGSQREESTEFRETPVIDKLEIEFEIPDHQPMKVGEVWGSEPAAPVKRGRGRQKKGVVSSLPAAPKIVRPPTSSLDDFTKSIFGTTRIDLNPGNHKDED